MPSPEILPVGVQDASQVPDKVGDMKHFNETFYGKVLLVAKCESHQRKDKWRKWAHINAALWEAWIAQLFDLVNLKE